MKRGLVAPSCARSGRKDVGVGSRTIATMRRQFHKLREKTPRGSKVALTNGPVHTRKRACKGRARGEREEKKDRTRLPLAAHSQVEGGV